MNNLKLYITGGSGSGTSTLGRELAKELGIKFFDTDDFFHKPTDPPFQEQYSKEERNHLLLEELKSHDSWIVSGSVSTWEIEGFSCTHAIFLYPGMEVRIDRLKRREYELFGDRIRVGGDMYEDHLEFIDWAKGYESNIGPGRTMEIEKSFIDSIGCKRLEITESESLELIVSEVNRFIKE